MAKNKEYRKTEEQIAEEELSKHTSIYIEECHNFLYANTESDTVRFIKAHLRTPEQKKWLDEQDLSIEDILNGRFGAVDGQEAYIQGKLFVDWNTKLGRTYFED